MGSYLETSIVRKTYIRSLMVPPQGCDIHCASSQNERKQVAVPLRSTFERRRFE